MKNRITHENIVSLDVNQIFVFGANLSGIHGKGAAKKALTWGAIYGQASGLQGKTYAIPTKNASIRRSLTVNEIGFYVSQFIMFAKNHPELTFLVTAIGTGLAEHKAKNIAPLFKDAVEVENIHLPEKFWRILIKES